MQLYFLLLLFFTFALKATDLKEEKIYVEHIFIDKNDFLVVLEDKLYSTNKNTFTKQEMRFLLKEACNQSSYVNINKFISIDKHNNIKQKYTYLKNLNIPEVFLHKCLQTVTMGLIASVLIIAVTIVYFNKS